METFNIYMIYIQVVLKRIYEQVPTDKLCTYCFMYKQNVEEIQK